MDQLASLVFAGLLGAFLVIGAALARRQPAYWTFAWASLLGDAALLASPTRFAGSEALSAALAALFPALLLADALSRTGPVPRALVPAGLGVGVLRALLVTGERTALSDAIALGLDPALLAVAAVVTLRTARRREGATGLLLGAGLVGLAGVEAFSALQQIRGAPGPSWFAWVPLAVPVIAIQAVSSFGRVWQTVDDLRGAGQRAAAALARSERRLRDVTEGARELVVELDAGGRVAWASPSFAAGLGHDPTRLVGRELLDLVHPDDRAAMVEAAETFHRTGGAPAVARGRLLHAEGRWRFIELGLRRSETEGGPRVVVTGRDVTDRVAVLDSLRASEERFRILSRQTSDVIAELGEDTRILWLSPNVESAFGFAPEELVGRRVAELADRVQPQRRTTLAELRSVAGIEEGGRSRFVRRDGLERWIEWSARTYRTGDDERRLLIVVRDVTRRIEEEHRLERERALESLRVFGTGVAHHVNNLLTVIGGNAALLRARGTELPDVAEHAGEIEDAADRAAALALQMTRFTARGRVHQGPLDLAGLVRGVAGQARALGAAVVLDAPPGLPEVEGDARELRELVAQLLSNAAEASPRGSEIRVSLAALRLPAAAVPGRIQAPDFAPGEHLCLEVEDPGTGMDATTRGRAFEPFFTTHEVGRGLGLSTVLGSVLAHRGAVELDSEPGKGTRVRVFLPVARGASTPRAAARA